MCLEPIRISKPSLQPSFIRRLYDSRLSSQLRSKVSSYSRNTFVVPCGKCVECLKRKQNDLATRCVREAEHSGNMVFVTLTYTEDCVPIACTKTYVDRDTAEEIPLQKPELCTDSRIRARILAQPIGRKPRLYTEAAPDAAKCGSGPLYMYNYTPSLDRYGFRMYLKRERIAFQRERLFKLPSFKYVAVGEYGPRTCRPHIHMALFGIELKYVHALFKRWNDEIGDVKIKQVKYLNDDKTKGYQIAAKYIGKYMCKGKMECSSVKCGFAQKPRICISHDFGTFLTQQQIDYYMAYDLFGHYNPNDISRFSESQLRLLVSEINSRMKVNVYGYFYSLPQNIKRRLFYRKYKRYDSLQQKTVIRFEPYQIQAYRVALLQEQFNDSLCTELLASGFDQCSEEFNEMYYGFRKTEALALAIRKSVQEKDFQRQYLVSIF